jgi:hypothetical protein
MKNIHRIVWLAVALLAGGTALAQEFPPDAGGGDSGTEDGGFDPGDADIEPFDELCPPGVVGCHTAEVDWLYRDAWFDDIMLDTGWVPPGSPIQLRFGLAIGGSTEVALGGTLVASWPPGIALSVPGRPGAGRLSINYGFEIIAQLRFDVEVAGVRYTWEGDIPIPFIPEDLRMAGDVVFDPFLLPGVEARPVSVEDATDRVRVFQYDALDTIIPLPGVGGGFVIAMQANLLASYLTQRIWINGAEPIEEEGGSTLLEPPIPEDPDETPGFGPSATVVLHPEGLLDYTGTIIVFPELYIEVAGTRFDFPLAEIPIDLVERDDFVNFDDLEVDIPLPEIDVQPARLNLGEAYVGDATAQPLVFVNNGEAPLRVVAETTDVPFTVVPAEVVVAPHRTTRVSVRFHPDVPGPEAVMFAFRTNDPDEPSVVVLLEGTGLERPVEPDAGPGDADVELDAEIVADAEPDGESDTPSRSTGCGCRVACSRGGRWLWLLDLLF